MNTDMKIKSLAEALLHWKPTRSKPAIFSGVLAQLSFVENCEIQRSFYSLRLSTNSTADFSVLNFKGIASDIKASISISTTAKMFDKFFSRFEPLIQFSMIGLVIRASFGTKLNEHKSLEDVINS